jgi:hypothetical protein
MEKVFCKNCRFLNSEYDCSEPELIDRKEIPARNSWYRTRFGYTQITYGDPANINKDNDCVWFKQKPWWRFWR